MESADGLLVTGGSYNGQTLNTIEKLVSSTWQITEALPRGNDNHAQVTTNGATYIFGGSQNKKGVWKLVDNQFEEIGQLKSLRVGATAQVIFSS